MTGRNHHAVGMGTVVEISTGRPGYDATRPLSAGTLAQTLSYNGYATGAFGKWHQTPSWEQTAAGPFDRWPTREGFDRFYGFLGGEASQFEPTLVEGTTFVDPPRTAAEGYHLSEDLVDQAQDWVRDVRTHRAGQAVVLLPGLRRDPRAVPGAGGLGRQVPRRVRARLGRAARAHPARGSRSSASYPPTRSWRRGRPASRTGTRSPTPTARSPSG